MVAIQSAPTRASLSVVTSANEVKHGDRRASTRDMYRFICALSGACERDCNVLRDGQLVDFLELQAKEILRARQQHRLSTSPVLRAKGSSPVAAAAPAKISKRRKLVSEVDKISKQTDRYSMSHFFSSKDKQPVDDVVSKKTLVEGSPRSSVIPGVKISKIDRRDPLKQTTKTLSPHTAPYALEQPLTVRAISVSQGPSHMSLDRFSLEQPYAKSVDLGASMVSTVSSSSMAHYETSDAESVSVTPTRKYSMEDYPNMDYLAARARSDRTRNAESFFECQSNQSTECTDSVFHESELSMSHRKDSVHSETSDHAVTVTPKKLRFEMDALSLLENDQATNELPAVKSLQSQVDSLLLENGRVLVENSRLSELSHMSAIDAEEQAYEKLRASQSLKQQLERLSDVERQLSETEQRADAQESCRREAEMVFQAELDAKAELLSVLQKEVEVKDVEITRLNRRVEDISSLFASKMREDEQRRLSLSSLSSLRRLSLNSSRRSSLCPPKASSSADGSSGQTKFLVDRLSGNVDEEDDLIMSLQESNLFKEMEMKKMRTTLMEKDREICHLYMHLSTKKKLIEEITKKFVQHMEQAAAANNHASVPAPTPNFPVEGVRFDLDMFLFKNVVDKQRRMEELTAALGVMDREVESLEARVAEKERENTQLRENQEVLTRSLQTVNAQVCRIQSDNARLDASLKEKHNSMNGLIASLEDKERQILHLDEQVELRQSQLDLFMSDKPTSRRSLKDSLFKGRSSSSSVKATPPVPRASFMSFSSAHDGEDLRSSFGSSKQRRSSTAASTSARVQPSRESVARSSADWSAVSRGSGIFSERPSVNSSSDWCFTERTSLDYRSSVSESEFVKRESVTSAIFDDIAAPVDDQSEFSVALGSQFDDEDECSNRASYCESDVTEGEDLLNQLLSARR